MLTCSSANVEKRLLTVITFMTVCASVGLLGPPTAWAHKVNVFAYVEGETVITESYFSDGRKCRDSTIEVFDDQGKKLLEGKTDVEGAFSFRVPVRTNLLIRLTGSMGHMAEYAVPATDLPETLPPSARGAPQKPETPLVEGVEKRARAPAAAPARAAPSMADIEGAVERALARQLLPIRRTLEETQAKRRFSDIVGGIGYIVGLMGLATYLHSRRVQRPR